MDLWLAIFASVILLAAVALIFFGFRALLNREFLHAIRHLTPGIGPALILFGVAGTFFALPLLQTSLGISQSKWLEWWWFLPPSNEMAPLLSVVGNPVMSLFLLGLLVLFWWPAGQKSVRPFFARLVNPATRREQVSQTANVLLTVVLPLLIAFVVLLAVGAAGVLLHVWGPVTALASLAAGLMSWDFFNRVITKRWQK